MSADKIVHPPSAEEVAALAGLQNDAKIVASLRKAREEIISAAAVVRASLTRNDEPAFGFHPPVSQDR